MKTMDLTPAEQEELRIIGALPDDKIDTSDIPEIAAENWKHATRNTVRVDRDVLKWFEASVGRDYASEINRVLRVHISEVEH